MASDGATRPRLSGGDSETVQLVVSDPGNREAIVGMLSEHFEVVTDSALTDADLYLIEDRLLAEYRSALRSRVEASHPTFHPVVVIQRGGDGTSVETVDSETPLLVDEAVGAPIDRGLLIRRLRSLLIRRRQSMELMEQVSTLEERERELRRFERAVEEAGNAIALLGTDGRIRYVNPVFESTTGYAEDDALGASLGMLDPDDPAFDDAFWRTMHERGSWEGEIVATHEDGSRYVADVTITTITDDADDVEGFVAVLRDITGRIRRERMLTERREELDLLRQVLTRYLRHNLRNDLNVVLGYAEQIATATDSETAEYADTIVRKTERLLDTGDTARRYSALIEHGGDTSRYDLSTIVSDAVAEIDDAYPEVSIDVDVPATCPIVASNGIRDVVVGLVENAAEHNTTPDPRVRVRVRPGSRPQLIVEDNGPGIPDHDLEAFDAGYESPLSHSTGIGVWLSKWVVEGSGGELSFDTGSDGTRVTVELRSPGSADSDGIDVTDLKARERRLQTVIDRMTDAVIEVDGSWQVTFIDSRAAGILDIDADRAVDADLWEVFAEARDTEFETVFRDAMSSRSADEIEAYYPPIDGWLAVYVYPDFDGGLSFYFRDVTRRKAREQELEHRQHLLREVYDVIADRTLSFAEQVEGLLAIGRAELDTAFGSLSRIEDGEYTLEVVDADGDVVEAGDTVPLSATNCEVTASREQTLVLGDIERDAPELTDRAAYTEWGIACYLGAPVFFDGEVYGTFCFYGTEPREGQFSEWEVTLVDLLSRWASYALQIERDTEQIRQENQRLDRFASVVSHDLRNPLNILSGSIELAAETGDIDHLARAERAIDRMNALVDDLLELARSNRTDPETEVVDLATVVDGSWEMVPTERANLTITADATIRADPTMLEQLVENLLRNSVEHGSTSSRTESGDSVEHGSTSSRTKPDDAVEHGSTGGQSPADSAEHGGDAVSITVSDVDGGFAIEDDGPGIPADRREEVFEVGYSTDDDGTGFGLAIVKDVADAHGWTVALTEGADGGARYEITGVDVVER